MIPHLREVERIDAVRRRVSLPHHLHVERPGGEVPLLNRVVQILVAMELILAGDLGGFLGREGLDPLVRLEMELDPMTLALRVHPLERVRAEPVHAAVRRRDAAIAEEDHELVRRFRRMREEVPDVVRLLAVRVGVLLLRVDEIGELDAVADEEHRRVVADEIPVAVFRVVLHREAAGIASHVRAAA